MIKGSPRASVAGYVGRDHLRAAARAATPAGHPAPLPPAPDPLASDGLQVWVGPYRLLVDATGRLIATHDPTGTTQVLMDPHGGEH